MRSELLPSREELAMSTCDILDQIASRMNQMPKQSKGWKELRQMRVDVVTANELYRELIPSKANSSHDDTLKGR